MTDPSKTADEVSDRTDPLAGIEPRQLAYVTLRELTPELRAHYACDPALECGHPDCQP